MGVLTQQGSSRNRKLTMMRLPSPSPTNSTFCVLNSIFLIEHGHKVTSMWLLYASFFF